MILLNLVLKSRNATLSAHQDNVIEREDDLISRDLGFDLTRSQLVLALYDLF